MLDSFAHHILCIDPYLRTAFLKSTATTNISPGMPSRALFLSLLRGISIAPSGSFLLPRMYRTTAQVSHGRAESHASPEGFLCEVSIKLFSLELPKAWLCELSEENPSEIGDACGLDRPSYSKPRCSPARSDFVCYTLHRNHCNGMFSFFVSWKAIVGY